MTINHMFYIPTIFLLGFIFGSIYSKRGQQISDSDLVKTANQTPSGKDLFYSFMVFILVFIITHMFEIPWSSKQVSRLIDNQEIFDRSPLFSSKSVYLKIGTFSQIGIETYKRFTYTVDVLFPISFFIFLFTFARFVIVRTLLPNYITKGLKYLPILWLVSDFIENLIIYFILSSYPDRYNIAAEILGIVTIVKFSLLGGSLIVPGFAYIFALKGSGRNTFYQ